MNTEKTPEEQLLAVIRNEVAKIISTRRGSGATVDDPIRLGAMHSLLAPMTEKFCVSSIYGKENRDWFDAGRKYYKNETICEQRVRLGDQGKPKQAWARPGHTYSMFFDISELTHDAPIPDAVKQLLMKGAMQMPLSDTTLVSRFPLIEVRANNAVQAARIIAGHLRAAEAQGWKTGRATALVDNWRNDYELTRGNEKTVMQFDMRPCLLSDSSLNLTALTLLAVNPQLEDALPEFEASAQSSGAPDIRSTENYYARVAGAGLFTLILSVLFAIAVGTFLDSFAAAVVVFFIAFFFLLRISAWIIVTLARKFSHRSENRGRPLG